MKKKLTEKFKVLIGGALLCIAYTPLFVSNFVSFWDDPALIAKSSKTKLYEFDPSKVNTLFLGNYFSASNLSESDRINDDFLASLAVTNDMPSSQSLETYILANEIADTVALLPANTSAVSVIENVQDTIAENIQKVVTRTAISPKKSVKVPGFGDATFVRGEIKSNFYVDARNLGIPAKAVDAMFRSISEKLNFKSSLHRGDKFEVIYDTSKTMIYGRIITKKADVAVYRFSKDKNSAYFFANGEKCNQSTRASGFGQPLAGTLRVSDRYGWRRHPITGRLHNHSGVDLRAPYGAPIYAIYDGVVKRASFYSGYGRCVDIQHVSGYSSRYAHLSRFAVRVGSHVKKGQIIGYVGSSGVSTGAHLHLELARNNQTMNPLSIRMIPTQKAVVPNRAQFNMVKRNIDHIAKKFR